MEGIDIPADKVPEGLKSCEQILKRAQEVKKVEPVVSYWCCFYAAQKALKVPKRSNADTALLMSLLDALEQMKAILADNDAIHNEAAGAAYVQNFALKVFMSADNDDRKGITGKATIRKFVASGQFIEVLNCFENGMTEEMSQKLSYARWKAADGAKALREGRTPTSGPPIPEPEIALPDLPSASPSSLNPSLPQPTSNTSSPALAADVRASPRPSPLGASGKANLPTIDTSLSLPKASSTDSSNNSHSISEAHAHPSGAGGADDDRTPRRTGSWASGAWSTVATPGLADDEAEDRRFPSTPTPGSATTATTAGAAKDAGAGPSGAPSPALLTPKLPRTNVSDEVGTPRSPNTGERKNVRFLGPDGAPLSPAQTVFTVDSYDAPAAPPPTMFSYDPSADAEDSKGSAPTTARSQTQSQPASAVPGGGGGGNTGAPASVSNGAGNGNGRARSGSTNGLGLHNTSNEPPRTAPPFQPFPPSTTMPSAPPGNGQSTQNTMTGPPPSAPPLHSMPTTSTQPTPKPTRKTVEQCQKHARWAISALEFDDPETARNELRKALALLG